MFDFVHHRRWFYLASIVLLLPGLISLVLPGGVRPGIDFTSGTLMTLRFVGEVEQSALRETFARIGHPEAVVQKSGDGDFVVRTAPLAQPESATAEAEAASGRAHIEAGLEEHHGPVDILSLDQVSALVAGEIVLYALLAVAAASACILLYLWWAFRGVDHPWRFGSTAVAALLHDGLVVLGAFSLLGRFFPLELDATFISAMLTVIGFSVHDTIVVFDRVRENAVRHRGEPFSDVVNHSVVQTMGRSLTTSLTVLLTLFVLLLFGGETIRGFILAMFVGIGVGTYSSIFVASMLLVSWERGELAWLGLRPTPARSPEPTGDLAEARA
jgi:preprotein translocase subunit SecF